MHDRNGVPIVVEGDWDEKGGTTKMWFAAKQLFVVAKAPTATQDGE